VVCLRQDLVPDCRGQVAGSIRAGDGVELIRESVRLVLQELIEAEAAEVIGAGRYERTDARTTERKRPPARVLSAKAGDSSWDPGAAGRVVLPRDP